MIRVLIADDEKHARDRLIDLLEKYTQFSIEYEANTGDEVIQFLLNDREIDVAFLDINMPGVSVFNTISSLKNPPLIVFQTAYSEYAVEAYNINAVDYLLKPISEERIKNTVEKIMDKLSSGKVSPVETQSNKNIRSFSVKNGSFIKIIPIEEIYHISFDEGFCFIYTEKERYLADNYLNYYEDTLINQNFFRTNRKDLINLKYIDSIHPMFNGNFIIQLKNKEQITLSRRRTKDLKNIIKF
jgi:two-component system, LytTR family, response regulator